MGDLNDWSEWNEWRKASYDDETLRLIDERYKRELEDTAAAVAAAGKVDFQSDRSDWSKWRKSSFDDSTLGLVDERSKRELEDASEPPPRKKMKMTCDDDDSDSVDRKKKNQKNDTIDENGVQTLICIGGPRWSDENVADHIWSNMLTRQGLPYTRYKIRPRQGLTREELELDELWREVQTSKRLPTKPGTIVHLSNPIPRIITITTITPPTETTPRTATTIITTPLITTTSILTMGPTPTETTSVTPTTTELKNQAIKASGCLPCFFDTF